MPATCKCKNGHTWSARVIEDSPEINAFEVEPFICPECDSDEMEIIDVSYDDFSDIRDME
jgi:Zn finger protein HypA/HybF involved in hydrogenase expression